MGSRLGRRVVHMANLPLKLLMPTTLDNIREIAFKTIPSASKIEIKRVLESLYGFEVDKVRTLNMEGKKKKRGGLLLAKPDYKKAYVSLKTPLSLSPDLFPLRIVQEEKERLNKQTRSSSFVEEGKKHWLDHKKQQQQQQLENPQDATSGAPRAPRLPRPPRTPSLAKFPWTNMSSGR